MTLAQARTILRFWTQSLPMFLNEKHSPPTWLILMRNGWVKPSGKSGTFPNGDEYIECRPTEDGVLRACERIFKEFKK